VVITDSQFNGVLAGNRISHWLKLIRQVVTWYESKLAGSVGRYVMLDISAQQIYWQLLGLLADRIARGGRVGRTRLRPVGGACR